MSLKLFVCVLHFAASFWARGCNKLGARPGFEPGTSRTPSKNHTQTPYLKLNTMSQWWNVGWELSVDKQPLSSVPQGHNDSPLYTQIVASDYPTHENDKSPCLQFKLLLTILLLVQQAVLFSRSFWRMKHILVSVVPSCNQVIDLDHSVHKWSQ